MFIRKREKGAKWQNIRRQEFDEMIRKDRAGTLETYEFKVIELTKKQEANLLFGRIRRHTMCAKAQIYMATKALQELRNLDRTTLHDSTDWLLDKVDAAARMSRNYLLAAESHLSLAKLSENRHEKES